jgi:hypothetical protein
MVLFKWFRRRKFVTLTTALPVSSFSTVAVRSDCLYVTGLLTVKMSAPDDTLFNIEQRWNDIDRETETLAVKPIPM